MVSTSNEILWTPDARGDNQSAAFRRFLIQRGESPGDTYESLHAWSITHRDRFWRAVWDWGGVIGDPGQRLLVDGEKMPGARFLPDATVNYAQNLLRGSGAGPAIIERDETGRRSEISHDDLRQCVFGAMTQLREIGIGPGDHVAAIVPNRIDTAVLMLAATGLGAVWSSCSPDFGASAALDRFAQLRPRLLIGCDGYTFGGKQFDTLARLQELRANLPDVAATLIVAQLAEDPDASSIPDARVFRRAPGDPQDFAPRNFNDPLYVMFSSGTTGAPKCIVHGVGGTLVQHIKEHQLHCDLRAGDRMLFFTTCGWMMWNWLVSALASDVTLCLYEGNPLAPDPEALLKFAAEEQVQLLGISPGWLSTIEKAGLSPRTDHDLSALRCIISTGSPLPPQGFRFAATAFGDDVQPVSMTGGTDIMGCFASGTPELPVRLGEIQAASLGMDMDFVDEHCESVREGRGELICRSSFPSMPLGFLSDDDGRRYQDAYFTPWPGIWRHGDFGEFVPHDDGTPPGVVLHGRSDAVLNRGGVRIGTAELYRQTETFAQIAEAMAITYDGPDREEILLFLRMQPGATLDDALRVELRAALRTKASPRHVPDRIFAVPDLPRTRSGKLVEIAVRDLIHGREIRNVGALANPEALDTFRDLEALGSG